MSESTIDLPAGRQVDITDATPAQRRLILGSLRRHRVVLLTADDHHHDVVVQDLAVDGWRDPTGTRPTMLVCRTYDADTVIVLPMRSLRAYQPMPFYPSDPRHPDYVPQAYVVRPATRKRTR